MPLLKEFEQKQSGVRALQKRLQELKVSYREQCGKQQSSDAKRDWLLLQQNRAKLALSSQLLDELEKVGDTREDSEG